ncbi:MAG: hypothetical protein DWQ36_10520 [Acidobacteria bacterium]|nr:MAG: hypothetical protein DWQ30_11555 [Acidobacteriota bacterium]REK07934.1 MAG: hypothetical protein DWQ36_10520 [Acidobacteriota bacterium]
MRALGSWRRGGDRVAAPASGRGVAGPTQSRHSPLLGLTLALMLSATDLVLAQTPEPSSSPPEPPRREVLGAPAALAPGAFERSSVVAAAGSVLWSEPDLRSLPVATLPAPAEVVLLETRGDWQRVQWGEARGWISVLGQGLPDPLLGLDEAVTRDQAARRDDLVRRRLERVHAEMEGEQTRDVAGYRLITDLAPRDLRRRAAERLLGCFAGLYTARTGLPARSESPGVGRPSGGGVEVAVDVVALFARQSAYEEFVRDEEVLLGVVSGGHAFPGFAALHLESELPRDALALLAHELAHLENARRFGQRLPAWLEEGLAEELSWAVAATGDCSRPGAFPRPERTQRTGAGRSVEIVVTWPGDSVEVACALAAWGDAGPPVAELLALDHEALMRRQDRPRLYAAAALLVRLLAEQPAQLVGVRGSGAPARQSGLHAILTLYQRGGAGIGTEVVGDSGSGTPPSGAVELPVADLPTALLGWLPEGRRALEPLPACPEHRR